MAEADATKDPALEPDNAITEEDGDITEKRRAHSWRGWRASHSMLEQKMVE